MSSLLRLTHFLAQGVGHSSQPCSIRPNSLRQRPARGWHPQASDLTVSRLSQVNNLHTETRGTVPFQVNTNIIGQKLTDADPAPGRNPQSNVLLVIRFQLFDKHLYTQPTKAFRHPPTQAKNVSYTTSAPEVPHGHVSNAAGIGMQVRSR